MPRVSEEHLERRRQQILDAARACFIRKGFYETSMQDIFKESGLSAGAVYRYFKSKAELVEAIAEDTADRLGGLMLKIVHEEPLPDLEEAIGRMTELLSQGPPEDSPLRIGPQAWAMALNDAQVAVAVRITMNRMRELWTLYAERMLEAGRLPPGTDTDAVGKVLFGLLPGYILQMLIIGDVNPKTMRSGLHALFAVNHSANA